MIWPRLAQIHLREILTPMKTNMFSVLYYRAAFPACDNFRVSAPMGSKYSSYWAFPQENILYSPWRTHINAAIGCIHTNPWDMASVAWVGIQPWSHGLRRMVSVAWSPSHVVVSRVLTSNNGTNQRKEFYLVQILQKPIQEFSRW